MTNDDEHYETHVFWIKNGLYAEASGRAVGLVDAGAQLALFLGALSCLLFWYREIPSYVILVAVALQAISLHIQAEFARKSPEDLDQQARAMLDAIRQAANQSTDDDEFSVTEKSDGP